MQNTELYSLKASARILGISTEEMSRLVDNGYISTITSYRQILIPQSALREFSERHNLRRYRQNTRER